MLLGEIVLTAPGGVSALLDVAELPVSSVLTAPGGVYALLVEAELPVEKDAAPEEVLLEEVVPLEEADPAVPSRGTPPAFPPPFDVRCSKPSRLAPKDGLFLVLVAGAFVLMLAFTRGMLGVTPLRLAAGALRTLRTLRCGAAALWRLASARTFGLVAPDRVALDGVPVRATRRPVLGSMV